MQAEQACWRRYAAASPSARAIVLLAVGLALAIVAYMSVTLGDLRRSAAQQANGEVAGLAQLLSEQTGRGIDDVAQALRGVRQRLGDELGSRIGLDTFLVQALLQARTGRLPQVAATFVTDAQGELVNSVQPPGGKAVEAPASAAAAAWFRHFADGGRDEVFVGGPELLLPGRQPVFYVGLRLTDSDGSFRGVVATAVRADYFDALYAGVAATFASRIALVDRDGVLLSGNSLDISNFGKSLAPAARAYTATLPLAAYPLAVHVAVDEEQALASWWHTAALIVPGVGLILFFLAVATWLAIGYLARRAAAERALRDSDAQLRETNRQLRELSIALQNVREEERARLSRELHDELGQLLTGIRMEVSWIGSHLLPAQDALQTKIAAVKDLIKQTIGSVRRLSADLRPCVLDDLGFAAAAGWYVDQYAERSGLAVSLSVPGDEVVVDEPAATALFRVMQEALTNVVRHASASRVDIALSSDGHSQLLTIRDDGVGCASQPGYGKSGLGLLGMRERIEALGGSFAVRKNGERGTVVEARVPLAAVPA